MEIYGISVTGRFEATGSTEVVDISASYAVSAETASYAASSSWAELDVKRFDDAVVSGKRHIIHWWLSDSSYGPPDTNVPGLIVVSYISGSAMDPETLDTDVFNTAMTDTSGSLVIQLAGDGDDAEFTYYLMAEVQGSVYDVGSGFIATHAA